MLIEKTACRSEARIIDRVSGFQTVKRKSDLRMLFSDLHLPAKQND